MGNRRISDAVRHKLYAQSGNQCAFPGCATYLFEQNSEAQTNRGEICHIEGLNPQSARYNPGSDDNKRNSIENLILLCSNHHKEIDQNPQKYTVESLKIMKYNHETSVMQRLNESDDTKFLRKLDLIFQKHDFDKILLTQSFDAPFPESYLEDLETGYLEIRALLNENCALSMNKENRRKLYEFTQLSEYLLSIVAMNYEPNGNGFAIQTCSCNRDSMETIVQNCKQIQKMYLFFRYPA